MTRASFSVVVETDHPRCDRFLATTFPDHSRTQWEAALKEGVIRLNGAVITKTSTALVAGDCLEGWEPQAPPDLGHVEPQTLPLTILYEDDVLLIINKEPDRVVHPGPGHPNGTILNAFLGHIQAQACPMPRSTSPEDIDDEDLEQPLPGLVHRLDRFTSGCLCLTKTREAQLSLQHQFKTRTVKKFYLALVRLPKRMPHVQQWLVDQPLARDRRYRLRMTVQAGGRPSQTRFTLMKSSNGVGLMLCELLTGRTHQIRAHLTHVHMPLLGDPLYGGPSEWKNDHRDQTLIPYPMLHAWSLGIHHPKDQRPLTVVAELHPGFIAVMDQLGLTPDPAFLRKGPESS
jgi:23S rRNA pseudouridine1911/1915/1917 synthase